MFYFIECCVQFDSDVPPYFDVSRVDTDGSGGKSIPVASIRKCVGVLIVRIILKT